MNIHIHLFHSKGAIADQAALEQFQKQWATYQDALAHKEVGHGALPPRQSPRLDLHDQDEWDQIDHHVTTCDYPETRAPGRARPRGRFRRCT
jgi:hypothetical protein